MTFFKQDTIQNLTMNHRMIYLLAAILLAGLGIYYFLFERTSSSWWMILLGGAVFNMYLAWNTRKENS
ncbi:MAG: hypothetical protein CMO01_25385 [Thalassobius sp.]|nr:hypothetical protein [Thalassovita sp.]|tara:strand:+ start:397 stop:600 length:204 start_codon:yes stop_codon:yes gene_type:complete